mgnify:CR=1 FL=1
MRSALGLAVVVVLVSSAVHAAVSPEAPAAGIARELAVARAARVADLRYGLQFVLEPHATSTAGRVALAFRLHEAGDLWLDFRGDAVRNLVVNGETATVVLANGHLLLPARHLRAGENAVTLDFTAPVAAAGKAITRFEDRDDHTEYLYTLFVPMDASMAFPCFDQPDLKARFQLELTAPRAWTVISNTALAGVEPAGRGRRRSRFQETRPISTYLFAFAAGPFRKVHAVAGLPGLYVRQSMLARAQQEAPAVQRVAAAGIAYLSRYFAQPFPFTMPLAQPPHGPDGLRDWTGERVPAPDTPSALAFGARRTSTTFKYDMVLIPGFAYGGMEHAGATFLREESVLFRTAPTHTDLVGRDLLVLHELTHQWFGDFTTMRWFDDLWLKEGFAQYMAYKALDDLRPEEHVWQRFYQGIKPAAYAIDATQGTTPIYQDIPNLKDAKSAYGAIVYSKAPALLKQLNFVLGDAHFRDGLRLYLREHAYGNAQWSDLVHAFEHVSGRPLAAWAAAWIERRGMPQVDVTWSCSAGRLTQLTLAQHDVLGSAAVWPIATQVLLHFPQSPSQHLRAELDTAAAEVTGAVGKPCPDYVFANDHDEAYGRFLLDARSRPAVVAQLGTERDLFLRTLLWGALWDAVREAELAPRDFLTLAQRLLPAEGDELLTQALTAHSITALHRYVSAATRTALAPPFETLAADRTQHAPNAGLRILWFRTLDGVAETPVGLGKLKALLDGSRSIPGVELRPLDRWSLVTSLLAMGDPQAEAVLATERRRDPSGDGQKYAYMAEAARPDAATKQRYFHDYLDDAARPEDWVAQSLGAFNYWNQSRLTQPYLRPALDALPQIKRDRKIFFLLGWLNAFIGGQHSPQAQTEVHAWLAAATLDPDLQRKVLEVLDELDRTVRIRGRYP